MGNKNHDKDHGKEDQVPSFNQRFNDKGKICKSFYDCEIAILQEELVKLQYWVKQKGLKIVIIFEGRDAAGKGGMINTITRPLNPRGCRVVALDKPSNKESTQWYFQRYISQLPGAGEIVIFDRSWYNRAGVERVMGFCSEDEYWEFLRSCPELEKMIIRSGIVMIKYWFSVSDEEQEKRFKDRVEDPAKRWKLSEMDLQGYEKWEDYSRAKDEMFKYTDTKQSPWFNVISDDKRRAHLNCINHILNFIHYEDVTPKPVELPDRKISGTYVRPPLVELTYVPEKY